MVLSAFSGEDDVVFGEVRACRLSSVPDAERIIGLLINTVPVRARVPGDRPLLALLRDLDENQVAVRAFEHTPLVEAAACSEVPRGTRLFDTIAIIDEADDATRLSGFGASGGRSFTLHDRTNFALTLKAVLAPTMTFTLSFEPGRFDTDFAQSRGGPDEAAPPRDGRASRSHAGGAATPAGPGRARTRVVQPDLGSGAGAGVRA